MSRRFGVSVVFFVVFDFVNSSPRIDNQTPQKDSKSWNDESTSDWALNSTRNLKLMTMNTWNTGNNVKDGAQKIANQILKINPDVIAIQELSQRENLEKVMEFLGSNWHLASTKADSAIISRHPIDDSATYQASAGMGTRIMIDGAYSIHVYSMHLAYLSYGPYLAFNRLVTNISIFDVGESYGSWSRSSNIMNLLKDPVFKKWRSKTTEVPLFVLGDFNCPSHLDWTEETKDRHFGWVYKWPATYLLQNQGKMFDSYRAKYPDPVKDPGTTWSTVQTAYTDQWNYLIPEPKDRIDFIFYRSPSLRVLDSKTYADQFVPQPSPPTNNVWPSDHYAVISEFQWKFRNVK